jgi:predicted RNase H-like nuclease
LSTPAEETAGRSAAACALAAERALAGRGRRLPTNPNRDRRGLRMEIWY